MILNIFFFGLVTAPLVYMVCRPATNYMVAVIVAAAVVGVVDVVVGWPDVVRFSTKTTLTPWSDILKQNTSLWPPVPL